jgi:hypothetical protein
MELILINMIEIYFIFRVFEFLSCFIREFGLGDKTLVDAAIKGYEQTLKRHHGILARSVFPVSKHVICKVNCMD